MLSLCQSMMWFKNLDFLLIKNLYREFVYLIWSVGQPHMTSGKNGIDFSVFLH